MKEYDDSDYCPEYVILWGAIFGFAAAFGAMLWWLFS